MVGIVAGSATYPGAGVLCTGAALRTRPGLVRYAGTAARRGAGRLAGGHRHRRPAGDAGRVQAWVVGPGMGTDDAARDVLAEVLATDLPVLVDADGLSMLAEEPALVRDRTAPTVLTPHDREFARFGTEVGVDRIGAARRLAADLGAVVLLKGDATVVAEPTGRAYVNGTGTPWLATAGTGDVLAGIAGSLLASSLSAGAGRRRRGARARPRRAARGSPRADHRRRPRPPPPGGDRQGARAARRAAWETRGRDLRSAPGRGGRRPRRHRRQHRRAP